MALSQRERILVGASAAAVFVCLNIAAYFPAREFWETQRTSITESQKRIKTCHDTLKEEARCKAQLRDLRARLQQSDPGHGGVDVITRVESVGSQLGFNFNQRAPSSPAERERFTEKSATFTYQCQWPGIIRFLFALTKQPEVYRVTSLRLRAETKDPNQLAGDMTIVTYYLTGNETGPVRRKPVDTPAPEPQDKP